MTHARYNGQWDGNEDRTVTSTVVLNFVLFLYPGASGRPRSELPTVL